MDCETIIEKTGSFGLYQKLLGSFLWFFIAPFVAFNNLNQLLMFLVPDHHCSKSYNYKNISNDNVVSDLRAEYSNVQIKSNCELVHSSGNLSDCIYGYEYDYSLIYPTIVSENDWVCDDSWKLYFTHSIYWTGSLFGVIIIGSISDKYGRVPAIAICHLIGAIAGTATIFFSHNFIILLISRAFMGFVVLSQSMIAFVLVMEYVGTDGRMITATLFLICYSITATCLPWIAYFMRNWKVLAVLTSVPLFIVPLICIFLIPESLRWLVSKGKTSKAEKVIKRMAKINGKTLSEEDSKIEMKLKELNSQSIFQMFSYKRLTKIFILTNIIWLFHNLCYNGGLIYAANASDNPFVMLSMNDAIDVCANFFSNKFSNTYGRKITTITSCIFAGLAYISAAFIPISLKYVQLTIILVGRLIFSVGYNVQYIYAAEVYPTVIRSRGCAVRMVMGSFGNLMSAQVVRLSTHGKGIPLLIFGLSSFVSSLAMFNLPETLGQPLPETFDDGNQLGLKEENTNPLPPDVELKTD